MTGDQLDNLAYRITQAANALHGEPATTLQKAEAASLLRDMLQAAERHGITLAIFDGIVDLPSGALHAILTKDRSARWYGESQ